LIWDSEFGFPSVLGLQDFGFKTELTDFRAPLGQMSSRAKALYSLGEGNYNPVSILNEGLTGWIRKYGSEGEND
jgi:hypothetical protein